MIKNEQLPKKQTALIYGAGKMGEEAFSYLEKDFQILGFIDSFVTDSSRLRDLPLYPGYLVLLNGQLPKACRICKRAPITDVAVFRREVENLFLMERVRETAAASQKTHQGMNDRSA